MHEPLDDAASRLLAALADGLLLTLRPYADLADRVGLAEADVIATLRSLRGRRTLAHLGAVFSPSALGYSATIGAVAVPEERVESAEEFLGAQPCVTHVFELDDRYRVWYVVVTPSPARLEVSEGIIAAGLDAADRYRVLPGELHKVTTAFDASGVPEPPDVPFVREVGAGALDRDEKALIRLLQGEFPLAERPFSALAITLGECGYDVDERWALEQVRALVASGIMRGIHATVREREEPWRSALVTWICPGDPCAAGAAVSAFPEVLHCFSRRVPGAGTALLSLVEASDRTELDRTVARIGIVADLDTPRVAYPVREFKRAPMKYFAEGE